MVHAEGGLKKEKRLMIKWGIKTMFPRNV